MKIETSFAGYIGDLVASLACSGLTGEDLKANVRNNAYAAANSYADHHYMIGAFRDTFVRRAVAAAGALLLMIQTET